MKLQADTAADLYRITAYGSGYVEINRQRHRASLVLMPEQILLDWAAAGFDALTAADLGRVAALAPELVLLGTGSRQRFPPPPLLRPLVAAQIGYEIMDTAAAARTYNVLMLEGRRVAAALLIE